MMVKRRKRLTGRGARGAIRDATALSLHSDSGRRLIQLNPCEASTRRKKRKKNARTVFEELIN